MMSPEVTAFFDEATNTISYVVRDPQGSSCAVIDSVLDFDYASGRTDTRSADAIIAFVRDKDYKVEWLLESHVHADHLSAAPYIQRELGGKIGIGDRIKIVQDTFGKVFNEGTEFQRDGSQFDRLFDDGDTYSVGAMECRAIHTPGHTPACMTHVMGDAAFVGDTLFMPDFGTARCDFPGGDAHVLFQSIQKLFALPDDTRVYVGHDYAPEGRDAECCATVAEHKASNIHFRDDPTEAEYRATRDARDATLPLPKLMLAALQINTRGVRKPAPESDGRSYLKIPLDYFEPR